MTRIDFMKGWLFLTAQPWGKVYRTQSQTTIGNEPTPADIQAEFYFQEFQGYDAETWNKACMLYAKGDQWPSISNLHHSIKDLTPPKKAITHQPVYCTMDEAFQGHPEGEKLLKWLRGQGIYPKTSPESNTEGI